jgi:multiple sugar transport system permease protein
LSIVERTWQRLDLDNHERRKNILAIVFLLPPILFLLIFGLFPALYTMYLSVTDLTIFAQTGEFVGLSNYQALYQESLFWESIVNGVVFAIGSTLFQLFVGLGLALVLNKSFRGSSLARTFAIFPYLVPTIAVALMWKWMLSPIFGVVNKQAVALGVIDKPIAFFNDAGIAMWSLIFANSWKFAAFAFIIFIARLQAIDDELYEQAKIMGAGTWQQFRDITLPNLRSAIMLVLFIRTIWMFNKFDVVQLLTGGGPLNATTTLPVFIYRLTFNQYDLAMGASAAINLFLGLIVLALIYFRVFKPSQEIETKQ